MAKKWIQSAIQHPGALMAKAKAAGMTVWGFVGGSHYVARDGRAMLDAAGADRVFDRMKDFLKDEEPLP